MKLSFLRPAALAFAALTALALAFPAAAETRLKMVLNWKYQGRRAGSCSRRTAATTKPKASTS